MNEEYVVVEIITKVPLVRSFKSFERADDYMADQLTRRFHKEINILTFQDGVIAGITRDEVIRLYHNDVLGEPGYFIGITQVIAKE